MAKNMSKSVTEIYIPYRDIPNPKPIEEDQTIQNVLLHFLKPVIPFEQEVKEIPLYNGLFGMRHFIAVEFWRVMMNRGFHPTVKAPKIFHQEIKDEANQWLKIIHLLEAMKGLGYLDWNPNIAFMHIVGEQGLTLFNYCAANSATLSIKTWQKENNQLRALENPFDSEKTLATHSIVSLASAISELNDGFRSNYYMPVVKGRSAITANYKKYRAVAYNMNGIQQRQGRKKENAFLDSTLRASFG